MRRPPIDSIAASPSPLRLFNFPAGLLPNVLYVGTWPSSPGHYEAGDEPRKRDTWNRSVIPDRPTEIVSLEDEEELEHLSVEDYTNTNNSIDERSSHRDGSIYTGMMQIFSVQVAKLPADAAGSTDTLQRGTSSTPSSTTSSTSAGTIPSLWQKALSSR
jgi:hypothetical protein